MSVFLGASGSTHGQRLNLEYHVHLQAFLGFCFAVLTSRNQYEQAIDEYFADDAVYESPVHVAKGKENIEHVFALHQAFRADSKLGEWKWNDQ